MSSLDKIHFYSFIIGQSAVDTGGVLRQFFTDCFDQMLDGGEDMSPLFEGHDRRKLPLYDSGLVLSEVMQMVGKIMGLSLLQAGIGMGCLAPSVFLYIASGEIAKAIEHISIEDTGNITLQGYINRVSVFVEVHSFGLRCQLIKWHRWCQLNLFPFQWCQLNSFSFIVIWSDRSKLDQKIGLFENIRTLH